MLNYESCPPVGLVVDTCAAAVMCFEIWTIPDPGSQPKWDKVSKPEGLDWYQMVQGGVLLGSGWGRGRPCLAPPLEHYRTHAHRGAHLNRRRAVWPLLHFLPLRPNDPSFLFSFFFFSFLSGPSCKPLQPRADNITCLLEPPPPYYTVISLPFLSFQQICLERIIDPIL